MIAREYKPIVYFEGVRMPIRQVTMTFRANGKSVIQILLPGDPKLWPKINISDVPEGERETQENGLEKVATCDLQGVQPRTLIQVFVRDNATEEEVFITEGRVASSQLIADKSGTAISVLAFGSVSFIEEVGMYMAETARSLGISSDSEWDGRDGTTTTSSIVSSLSDSGLDQGIRKLFEDAGLKTSQATNLTWRLLRFAQRLSVVNNPSALGHFNETRLSTILDKTVGQVSSRQPIASVIMSVLRLLRYFVLNVPAPSFLNAKYSGDDIIEIKDADPVEQTEEENIINETEVDKTEVIYTALLTDLNITNPEDLQMNELIIFPQMPFAPPPRCNVFFPIDYESLTVGYNWDKRPTRGISRASGRSALKGDESDAVKLPESYADNSTASTHGRYYTMAEEKYRGIILSAFNYDRPEFIDDMGSDYVRDYMTQSFYAKRYNGSINFSQPGPLNLKPIPGLPALILLRNGQHILAHLDQITHKLTTDGGCITLPVFSLPRHYAEESPVAATGFWFEDEHFHQENIGIHIYKKIIGKYFTAKDELSADPEAGDDLSILKHLYCRVTPGPDAEIEIERIEEQDAFSSYSMTMQTAIDVGLRTMEEAEEWASAIEMDLTEFLSTKEAISLYDTESDTMPTREVFESQNPIVIGGTRLMTEDEVEEAKEAPTAIKDAIDLLWAEYSVHGYPEIYSYNYGRRIPITRKHLYEDFYNAVVSPDLHMVAGGYSLITNSISLTEADREKLGVELGDAIENEDAMDDIKPMGCFIKERQECYIRPAARLFYGRGVARDASELLDILQEIDDVADIAEANIQSMILTPGIDGLTNEDDDYPIYVPIGEPND